MAAPLLRVRDLVVEFPRDAGVVRAAAGIDFDVDPGEIVGLVGESGSGKSATALALLRLVPPPGRIVRGEVRLDGTELLSLSEKDLRRHRGAGIAYVPQEPSAALNPVLRIGAQIVDVIRAHRSVTKDEAWAEAERALERVGIPDPARRVREYPHQFSGGMKQRALIAMALSARPRVLVADEPTTALDATLQAGIVDLLRSLRDSGDLGGIVMITHDLGVVAALCDRVAVMYAGRIVEEAPVDALFDDPRHPYTRALIESLPRPDAARGALPAIPGQVPDLANLPSGCPFHPRCRDAEPRCPSWTPRLVESAPGRRAACIHEEDRSDAAGEGAR